MQSPGCTDLQEEEEEEEERKSDHSSVLKMGKLFQTGIYFFFIISKHAFLAAILKSMKCKVSLCILKSTVILNNKY